MKNVILLTVDTLRKDVLGCYGNKSGLTPFIDSATHSFIVETHLDNSRGFLLPGMFASAEVILRNISDSVLLPEEALFAIAGRWCVFKVIDDVAVLEEVMLGLRKPGKVQILSGVEIGDTIVTHGNQKVKDGQQIKSSLL